MKKSVFFKSLVLVSVLAGSAAHAFPSTTIYTETEGKFKSVTADGKTTTIGQSWGSLLDIWQTYNFNARYTATPEIAMLYNYASQDVSHDFARLTFLDKNLAKLNDNWNLQMGYRYVLPTTDTAQKAGSFGSVSARPTFVGTYGKFSLMAREIFSLSLNRSALQRNPGTTPPTGNALWALVTEIIPAYDIGSGFSASLYVAPQFTYYAAGHAPNKKLGGSLGSGVQKLLDVEFEVDYSTPAIWDITVGARVNNDQADLGNYQLNSDTLTYTFVLTKTF